MNKKIVVMILVLGILGLSFGTLGSLVSTQAPSGVQRSDGIEELSNPWLIENKGIYSIIGTEDDNCVDVSCGALYTRYNPFTINFDQSLANESKIIVEFKAKIVQTRIYDYDLVTYLGVNGLLVHAWEVQNAYWATINGSEYSWYSFSFSPDLNLDGTVDWVDGDNEFSIDTWSGYNNLYPAVSAWDVIIVSVDYDGNGIPDYKEGPCHELEILKQTMLDSTDSAWRNPAENRKNAMIEKIDECIVLCQNEEYNQCYDKILHDIKPKLTGLKVDEEGNPFGNGIFKNPWVVDPSLQEEFGDATDSILSLLATP